MGEIVDMILEGILCQQCGVYLGPGGYEEDDDFEGHGFPSFCEDCAEE